MGNNRAVLAAGETDDPRIAMRLLIARYGFGVRVAVRSDLSEKLVAEARLGRLPHPIILGKLLVGRISTRRKLRKTGVQYVLSPARSLTGVVPAHKLQSSIPASPE